jgi:hypothetical protein
MGRFSVQRDPLRLLTRIVVCCRHDRGRIAGSLNEGRMEAVPLGPQQRKRLCLTYWVVFMGFQLLNTRYPDQLSEKSVVVERADEIRESIVVDLGEVLGRTVRGGWWMD